MAVQEALPLYIECIVHNIGLRILCYKFPVKLKLGLVFEIVNYQHHAAIKAPVAV